MRDRWWENALQSCSILAAVGGSATLEYRAGEHAGWPLWQAMLVPFALDAYVVRTLTNRLARRGDQVFALALLVAAVALSVFTPPPVWQAFGLGLVIVATLWRMDAQWRRKRVAVDLVAEMGERLRLAREDTATARRELTAAREATADMINDAVADERRRLAREVADLRRQLLATGSDAGSDAGSDRPSDRPRVGDVDPPPVAADKDTQIAWVRRLLESDADATWRDVAEHLQLEPRAAQYRVTAARRPAALHSVTAVEATS